MPKAEMRRVLAIALTGAVVAVLANHFIGPTIRKTVAK